MNKLFLLSGILLSFFLLSSCLTISSVTGEDENPFDGNENSIKSGLIKLHIYADIEDVNIYIDGNYMGKNDITHFFKADVYKIEIKSAGYETYEETINLDKVYTVFAKMIESVE